MGHWGTARGSGACCFRTATASGDSSQGPPRAVVPQDTLPTSGLACLSQGLRPHPTEGLSRPRSAGTLPGAQPSHPRRVRGLAETVSKICPSRPSQNASFITKWPSPGPSLAGMGERGPERSEAVHASGTGRTRMHTHTSAPTPHANTPVHACQPETAGPAPGARRSRDLGGQTAPSRAWGGGSPQVCTSLLLCVHCAKEGCSPGTVQGHRTHLLLRQQLQRGQAALGSGARAPGAGPQVPSAAREGGV